MAYLAGVTNRIHVGSGIINITPPVNPPARVAERVAMLDHLSGGRFEFGVGRGSSTTEQRGFGIEDPELTKEMVDEVLPQFKRMWTETNYSFDGRFFSMPPRNVLPKPYTKPHPPMWIAAGNPGTFQKAARMGLGVLCFTMGSPESLKKLIEVYKTEIEHAEPVGAYVNNNIMVTSQMLCLEDGQKARDIACNMTSGYQNSLVFRYLDTFPKPPGIPVWPELIPEPTPEGLDASIKAGLVCVGTPEEVNKSVQGYVDAGADQLTFGMLSTTMPIDIAIEAVETFGAQVLPNYDKDPVHSTTRQREEQLAKQHA
jgi:alkanesulfonate monooxygenase SsuD/methylene tetrahydromethanopterin reductase-like flavin-dependent oxidoreductase (luciferase family)